LVLQPLFERLVLIAIKVKLVADNLHVSADALIRAKEFHGWHRPLLEAGQVPQLEVDYCELVILGQIGHVKIRCP